MIANLFTSNQSKGYGEKKANKLLFNNVNNIIVKYFIGLNRKYPLRGYYLAPLGQ